MKATENDLIKFNDKPVNKPVRNQEGDLYANVEEMEKESVNTPAC